MRSTAISYKEPPMMRLATTLVFLACLCLAGLVAAADTPSLSTAQGTVDKVEKDSLTLKPRGPDGKFQKAITLKLTGTSKVTTLAPQTRGGKLILSQKDTDAKDLQPGQAVAVIYASVKEDAVLLSAVVQPAGEK